MAISTSSSPAPIATQRTALFWTRLRRCAGAAHCSPPAEIEQIERKNFAVERRKSSFPARHLALPAAPHRRVDRLGVAAVDPESIRQIRPAEIGFALGVVTMAGDAIGGEDGLAGVDFRRRHFLCDSRIGKAAHIIHDVFDFVLLEQSDRARMPSFATPCSADGRN